ncbi:chromosome partitioning protein ParA [Haladaptatus sp. W1]|uniref:ParA family protein n=1 Tax=Haladaptatus sp. W1 TaxID=1897478 RepID=UPI0008497B8D|nr:ParA family protein [Haladaptatus sp. W1]ODR81805.1 chromosome partitioning protein ParA [Haladaptatus sp. W1]
MSDTAKIAVSNQKGGVGKTTVAINVAGALNQRGHDVLFVDLDPQGNATEGLGLEAEYEAQPPTLFDVLTDHEEREDVDSLIVSHEEMDVLPSNIDMTSVEPELTMAMRGRERLTQVLDALDTDYDVIIIDCPPYLGNLTDNALLAAGNVLIPALAESTSKRALEILFDQMEVLEAEYDTQIRDLGLVANRVETTNEADAMLTWFDEVFTDIPVWEVRKRVTLQRAFSAGCSLFEVEEECDMTAVFLTIAEDLEQQFGSMEMSA